MTMTSQSANVKLHTHCARCVRTDCTIPSDGERSCDLVSCKYGCGQKYHECKDPEHIRHCQSVVIPCLNKKFGCPKELPRFKIPKHLAVCPASVVMSTDGHDLRRDEYYWYHKNLFQDCGGEDLLCVSRQCTLSQYGCDFRYVRMHPKNAPYVNFAKNDLPGFFEISASSDEVQSAECQTSSQKKSNTNPTGQDISSDLQKLDIKESSDGKAVLQRMFSVGGREFSLEMMPSEILHNIVRYLDPFSLSNLSLTCHTLRDICASLLPEKGMVVSKWQHGEKAPKKVWKFSKFIGPLTDWCYTGDHALLLHLQECPYIKGDNVNRHADPFCLLSCQDTDLEAMKKKLV